MINRLTLGQNGKQLILDKIDEENFRIIDNEGNQFNIKYYSLAKFLYSTNRTFNDIMQERKENEENDTE